MNSFQTEINRVVSDFVAQITVLAREAARDMIEQALTSGSGGGARIARPRGGKRDPAELEKLASTVQTFVAKHPGLRIEQINKQLGTSTKELALPIRKLVSEGALKTKGKKRSTTYFAAKGQG